MATLRKAYSYSKRKVTPYTRTSKRRQKSFIKMVPAQKIVKFTMGKTEMLRKGRLPHHLTVVTKENVQLRHNAMEACRQFINKKLEKEFGQNYVFKIHPFPHHIQRENKMITGAGADRMQTGMQLSFGKATSKAAILKKGATIFTICLENQKAVTFIRAEIKKIKSKLPCKIRVDYEKVLVKKDSK
jgi:large subunit ribosomal protein L10e